MPDALAAEMLKVQCKKVLQAEKGSLAQRRQAEMLRPLSSGAFLNRGCGAVVANDSGPIRSRYHVPYASLRHLPEITTAPAPRTATWRASGRSQSAGPVLAAAPSPPAGLVE